MSAKSVKKAPTKKSTSKKKSAKSASKKPVKAVKKEVVKKPSKTVRKPKANKPVKAVKKEVVKKPSKTVRKPKANKPVKVVKKKAVKKPKSLKTQSTLSETPGLPPSKPPPPPESQPNLDLRSDFLSDLPLDFSKGKDLLGSPPVDYTQEEKDLLNQIKVEPELIGKLVLDRVFSNLLNRKSAAKVMNLVLESIDKQMEVVKTASVYYLMYSVFDTATLMSNVQSEVADRLSSGLDDKSLVSLFSAVNNKLQGNIAQLDKASNTLKGNAQFDLLFRMSQRMGDEAVGGLPMLSEQEAAQAVDIMEALFTAVRKNREIVVKDGKPKRSKT